MDAEGKAANGLPEGKQDLGSFAAEIAPSVDGSEMLIAKLVQRIPCPRKPPEIVCPSS